MSATTVSREKVLFPIPLSPQTRQTVETHSGPSATEHLYSKVKIEDGYTSFNNPFLQEGMWFKALNMKDTY